MSPAKVRSLPADTRSIALLDAENIFHGLQRVANYVVEALEDWLHQKLPDPRTTMEYGKHVDPSVRATFRQAGAYRYRRIDVPEGKDKADDALVTDLTDWAPRMLHTMVGTGDRKLLVRTVQATHGTPTRIDWVVVGPQYKDAELADFDGVGELGEIGRASVRRIGELYQRFFGRRLARDRRVGMPRAGPRSPWGPLPELPGRFNWASLNPGAEPVTSPVWRAVAATSLAADGLNSSDAAEIADALACWLPRVIPVHRLGEDQSEDSERWEWYCLAALACSALAPGVLPTEVAVAAYLHVWRQDADLARMAQVRAEACVTESYGTTRRATLEAHYGPFG